MRGVTGMGPQRHQTRRRNRTNRSSSATSTSRSIKQYYLGRDPAGKRSLMGAFGDGTADLDGVRQIVEHFKTDIEYWEPRNEPNYGPAPPTSSTRSSSRFTRRFTPSTRS